MNKSIIILCLTAVVSGFAGQVIRDTSSTLTFDAGAHFGAAYRDVDREETGIEELDDLFSSVNSGNTFGIEGNMVYRKVALGLAYYRFSSSESGSVPFGYTLTNQIEVSETVNFMGPYVKFLSGNMNSIARFNIGIGFGYAAHYLNLQQNITDGDSSITVTTEGEGNAFGTLYLIGVQFKLTKQFGFDIMSRYLSAQLSEMKETTKSSNQSIYPNESTTSASDYPIGFFDVSAGLRYYF